jgi:geranylgeranyl pyrophosphate synthase
MNLEKIRNQLAQNLQEHLNLGVPRDGLKEVYEYALFPTGKLFRPLLVWAVAKDLDKDTDFTGRSNHGLLASSVEFHHSYSLIHDDLPSMDNDTLRRGKPCTHLAFNEWKALLAGDGLLNLSYQTLSKINSKRLPLVFKLMGNLLGIQGQALDLSGEITKNFNNLLETHKLKTARLIQFSILSSFLLDESLEIDYRKFLDLFRLGHRIGITFQLLDDLTELTDFDICAHERLINPWFNFKEQTFLELIKGLKTIFYLVNKYELTHVKIVMEEYFGNIEKIINGDMVTDIPTSKILDLLRSLETSSIEQ